MLDSVNAIDTAAHPYHLEVGEHHYWFTNSETARRTAYSRYWWELELHKQQNPICTLENNGTKIHWQADDLRWLR